MIAVVLRDLRWRLVFLTGVALVFYLQEPGFHQHEGFNPDALALGALGISATLSNFAGLAMIILLSGFISTELRDGYTRVHLSYPVTPLGYYGLRWGVAYAIAIAGSAVFLVVGQVVAWGSFLGGWQGLLLPVLSALIYGAVMALLSGAGVRMDATIAFIILLLPAVFPELVSAMLGLLTPSLSGLVNAVLPPQNALSDIWDGLLAGAIPWDAAAYAGGYGAAVLATAALILRLREWP